MAKQIKPEGETATTQEPEVTTAETRTETVTATKDATKNEPKPEAYVLSVLQAFPNYGQLYVDRQGGVYTPDTPENLRPMATLYKNLYFIQP